MDISRYKTLPKWYVGKLHVRGHAVLKHESVTKAVTHRLGNGRDFGPDCYLNGQGVWQRGEGTDL